MKASDFFQEVLFVNAIPYTSYRLIFPTVRDAVSANSMQIADEMEKAKAAAADLEQIRSRALQSTIRPHRESHQDLPPCSLRVGPERQPEVRIVGVESTGAPAMTLSVERGELVYNVAPPLEEDASAAEFKEEEKALALGQGCINCHGPEGEGKTLDDGRAIPNLRELLLDVTIHDAHTIERETGLPRGQIHHVPHVPSAMYDRASWTCKLPS